MREESIFGVVVYLFKSYLSGRFQGQRNCRKLIEHLEEEGFEPRIISQAFAWLDRFVDSTEDFPAVDAFSSLRIYSAEEDERIDQQSKAFITWLECQGILRPHTREMVITQALSLQEPIDIHLLKWITLMVLFTHPQEHQSLLQLDLLISGCSQPTLH